MSADEFASPSFDEKGGGNSSDSDKSTASMATIMKSGAMPRLKPTASGTEMPMRASGGFEGFDPSLWSKLEKNQLNLAGLLNVLDGVVDTPGRLVILTTNYPEMLDPGLIRPSRIDKKLMLAFISSADVTDM